jgi:inner membrane protein
MDSLTHIALGAVIGEAYAGKALGKKALVIGALAQSLPDVDFVTSLWLSPVDTLLAHRGFTHSILFALVAAVLLGIAAARRGRSSLSARQWILFFGIELAVHLFLDSFNNYGIGWFEPFSRVRISFNTLFVADPFFTLWPVVALMALFILKRDARVRKQWTRWSLVISSLYLVYALYHKYEVDGSVRQSLADQKISSARFFSTPTAFNNWLWYVVAEADSGYYIGYRSVFDSPGGMHFEYFPRQTRLLDRIEDKKEVRQLLRFCQGYYTVENRQDSLVFNDLRFGQITGWNDPRAKFAFHYYLNYPEANSFVVQRGRFANWNRRTIRSMVRRMAGNSPGS